MSEPSNSTGDWLRDVAERLRRERESGAAPDPERLTVREFLGKFGKFRRGYKVVKIIQWFLDTHGLRTSPDFQFEYVDNLISIELDEDNGTEDTDERLIDPTIRIDILKAAHNNPVRVAPDDSLVHAITIMWMKEYSQLPIMTTDKEVKGVISWRSIGKAYTNGHNPTIVRECMEKAHEIDTKTTLAEAARAIREYGYVLVRGVDKMVTGIVTTVDLADQFNQLAHPFLLVGEIERHLRNLVRGKFTPDKFKEAGKDNEGVKGPDDLTFGGYLRLLEREDSWKNLELNIDRKEFIKHLDTIRTIRNEVMHFSVDEREPEDIENLEMLARFLRDIAHTRRARRARS